MQRAQAQDLMDDPFETFKGVHVKLSRDTLAGLRIVLFKKNLSLQQFFEETASLLVNEDPKVIRIVDDLVMKVARNDVDKIRKYNKPELEEEILYNMIESQNPMKERGPDKDDE